MKKEIERKYEIKYLPDDIAIEKIIKIEQAFIYKDINTIIRIRKIENVYGMQEDTKTEYIYTLKTKGDIEYNNKYNIAEKYEIENNISEDDYKNLIKNKISNVINKKRIVAPIQDGLKVEIDIYDDYLEGLVTSEVEFADEQTVKNFKKPQWLGKEIGYKELSNRKLSEMSEEQFRTKVSKEFMENNKIVIEKLCKRKELENL